MESRFFENIRALRKQQGITQEQLAEAMGVTVGAVYKWEQDLSTPDICMIMELTHFFGVSVDALIGYEIKSNTAKNYLDEIKRLIKIKKYDLAACQAEQALVRYPNHFEIVYRCAQLYEVKGIENPEQDITKDMERAVELFEKAELLLPQNTDPEISTFTIQTEIAQCRLGQKRKKEALEILKQNNVGGLHNALIGLTYALSEEYPPEQAAPYLTKAFGNAVAGLVRTMMGYINYYERTEQPKCELEAAQWLLEYLKSVKIQGKISYADKLIAPLCSECARLMDSLGETHKAQMYLREAFCVAKAYDAAPTYSSETIRFCTAGCEPDILCDDIGPTAMFAVEQQMEQEPFSDALCDLWKKLKEGGQE